MTENFASEVSHVNKGCTVHSRGDLGCTLVKVLCKKSVGRWCHWNFSLTYNPSDRTMVLGSTQPLTEMSTRSISWGKGGRCVRLTTLPPSCAVLMKSGSLNFLEPSVPLQACNGTASPLPSIQEGTSVAHWLRCCAKNRKVADVIGIFHWHKILPIALWPWGWLSL